MGFLQNLLSLTSTTTSKKPNVELTTDQIAELLKTTPEAIKAFEDAYQTQCLDTVSDNFFDINSRQMKNLTDTNYNFADIQLSTETADNIHAMHAHIVEELIAQTTVYSFDGDLSKPAEIKTYPALPDNTPVITNEMIQAIPEPFRPQLTGTLCKKDIAGDTYPHLLWMLAESMKPENPASKRKFCYDHFRQGLDLLDLDAITYEILGMNRNSMGNWLPQLVESARGKDFFKIPATKVAKVPMTLLQLTRTDFEAITPATKHIINEWATKVFDLQSNGDYFIKTGTYSSKFDFRNARVTTPEEVHDIGEYLLYIHYQALSMSHSTNNICVYGASTTNEWVVREFIPDSQRLPTIYKGLPLRCEYRVFIDCDSNEVLGCHPYWDETVMNKRFAEYRNNHDIHDGVTFKLAADRLTTTYMENEDRIKAEVARLLPDLNLTGQWSIDIMQNENDFYLIDMAIAENSAYYKETVPEDHRIPSKENWIPKLEIRK